MTKTTTCETSRMTDIFAYKRAELINVIMASHAGKGRQNPTRLTTSCAEESPHTYLVAATRSNQGIFLVWFDADSPADLTEEIYETIAEEAEAAGLSSYFHVHSKRSLIFTDDVAWYELPRLPRPNCD